MKEPLPVFFTPRARREVDDALAWWREHREAAPELLARELRDALNLAASVPSMGQPMADARLVGVRRVLLRQTRYHAYYRATDARLEVLALWHERREPVAL